jgi:predicted phosphate transport protein (TIGR00153 family)
MPFGKREAKVEELVFEHFEAVGETLQTFLEVVDLYLKGDPEFVPKGHEVHKAEGRADDIRREIVLHLFEGAYTPVFREDYHVLAELVDRVANRAESVVDDLVLEKPAFPEELKNDIMELAKDSVAAFQNLRKALDALFSDMQNVLDFTGEVSRLEGIVDRIEWEILTKLFEMDMELAEKIIMRDTIRAIGSITDRMEDASDRMTLMVVKRRF